MHFILRVFVSGLIAIVPGQGDEGPTLLFLDVPPGYTAQTGMQIEPHTPMLLARADRCTGPCRSETADLIRAMGGPSQDSPWTEARIDKAVGNGAAWLLDGEDLSLAGNFQSPGTEPGNGLSWVPSLDDLAASPVSVDPSLLEPTLSDDRISARLTLPKGSIRTHDFIRFGDIPVPIHFKESRGSEASNWNATPLANWLAIDIQVAGCEVEVGSRSFGASLEETIQLGLEDCEKTGQVLEMVVMNVPRAEFDPQRASPQEAPRPGNHFETYFEISSLRDEGERYVPYVAADALEVRETRRSSELPSLGPDSLIRQALAPKELRGSYSQIICPLAQLPRPQRLAGK